MKNYLKVLATLSTIILSTCSSQPSYAETRGTCTSVTNWKKDTSEGEMLKLAVKVYRFNKETLDKIEENYNVKNNVAGDDTSKNATEGVVVFFKDGTGTIILYDYLGTPCESGYFYNKDFFNEWMLPFIGESA